MKEIGGYFELELPAPQGEFIHSNCVLTNSGRHALEYILTSIKTPISKIWLPYYTCEVVLQPIIRLGLKYEFYHIDTKLELSEDIKLADGEYIIVNNYFGIKDKYVGELAEKYGNNCIIDNAQAWYAKEILGVSQFYSPRKFFGMPDGGVACSCFTNDEIDIQDYSSDRCAHLLKRIDINAGEGYSDFRSNSNCIRNQNVKRMSRLSHRILASIDFDAVKSIRRSNFAILNEALRCSNMLSLPNSETYECPMVYPYLTNNPDLRRKLISNKIFVATYWPNVLTDCNNTTIEYQLAQNILPLPIDQRYDSNDMERIVSLINAE